MVSLWPRRACRLVRGMWSEAVGTLLGGQCNCHWRGLSFRSVCIVFVYCTHVTPRSFCRFKEGDDECLVGKLFVVTARDSDADRRESRLVVYFVTDGSVVVQFVSVKVGKSSRAVVYGISVPFLAGLNGRCAEIIGLFGLAFYKQIAGEFVCGANGPSGVHLEDLRDSIELKARLAGYMSSDGVADVVSGRSVGFNQGGRRPGGLLEVARALVVVALGDEWQQVCVMGGQCLWWAVFVVANRVGEAVALAAMLLLVGVDAQSVLARVCFQNSRKLLEKCLAKSRSGPVVNSLAASLKCSEDPEFGVVGGWSCVTVVASAGN
ncbi:hypothetical protein X797_012193 [Metarhizium robertsii]|uniref:Uncharacterized protein n=1 Tax=Metarhizium robertsii TaxID=568076 RepID=A0A014PGP0_9HYPO|nr:hypothetical protein X797_012193 [Metarhizium robertsii]